MSLIPNKISHGNTLLKKKYSEEGEALIKEIYNLRKSFEQLRGYWPGYLYLGNDEWLKLTRYPDRCIYTDYDCDLLFNMKVFRVETKTHLTLV